MASNSSAVHETRLILKVDNNGLPLIPQPAASPLDPLNYPNWLKYIILVEVSTLGFISGLCGTLLNPAVGQLSQEFHISPNVASYQSAAVIVAGALTAPIMIPLANAYGHRLVFLLSSTLTMVFMIAAAESKSFSMLFVLRTLTGVSWTNAILGVAVISNTFFVHQRGKMMGFFTVVAFNGSHSAPIIGGYVAFRLGWRWTLWLGAIVMGVILILVVFLLPDTLFQRPHQDLTLDGRPEYNMETKLTVGQLHQPPPMQLSMYLRSLYLVDRERMPSRGVHMQDIFHPFKMLKYPSVLIPGLYYSVIVSFGSLGPLIIAPAQFTEIYHFNSLQNGLATGLSLMIGTTLGELFSGPITDFLIRRARKRASNGGRPAEPEIRLQGLWPAAAIVPLGLLLYGFTIRFADAFVAPCIALAITSIGVQIVTSVCLTYTCSDCYPLHSGGLSQCFGFIRSIFTLALTFFEVPMGQRIGYHWTFTIFAVMCILLFLPIVALMIKGAEWREKIGMPED